MPRKKVTMVGAGNVGATAAQRIVEQGWADVVLVDVVEGLPQGKGLDMLESGPILGFDSQIVGRNEYRETADSDLVIVTAGIARRPGMSRDDLLKTNMGIMDNVIKEVTRYSPNCILFIVSNPVDAMVYQAYKLSRFPKNRVVGMAGILDTGRMRTFIARELNVSVEDVQALVLGGHGDTMVPLVRYTSVGGIPLERWLPKEKIDAIVQRTRDGGGEIVNYLKTGSAYYAPAAAVLQMTEAILLDKKRVLPCIAYLEGEYGIHDLYIGVPVVLGAGGVEKVIEIALSPEEKTELTRSAQAVREQINAMKALDKTLA
ncbi:MAG: malate dehydrogenase [Chloroflexi bacterium]|nr:malate dehydrogenase [Chloroflexota bacterium]